MIDNPKDYIREDLPKRPEGLPIITDIEVLQKPCDLITKEDNIKGIIQNLKDTLVRYEYGLGLSANQIGINKRISYIKIPKVVNKKVEYSEYILINAKIIEKDRPIKVTRESCLSFSGVNVTTKRYVFITVEYYNEKMELQTMVLQDLEALVVQHECDHQLGITLFQRKWVSK